MASDIPWLQWSQTALLPEELDKLRTFARAALNSNNSLEGWTDRKSRIAIYVLANDWRGLAHIAEHAIKKNYIAQYEVKALFSIATPDQISEWLTKVASRDLRSHVIARILEEIRALGQPQPLIAIVDLIAAGRLPKVVDDFMENHTCSKPRCVVLATKRLLGWARGEALLLPKSLDVLLSHLDVTELQTSDKRQLTSAILKHASKKGHRTVAKLTALSRLGDNEGLVFLAQLTQRHVEGRISFGYAEREALIDNLLRNSAPSERLTTARAMILRTEQDAEIFENSQAYKHGKDFAGVERAYLEVLKDTISFAASSDHALLKRISERMTSDTALVGRAERARAFGKVLSVAPKVWLENILKWPPPPLVDAPWSNKWNVRKMVLRSISEAGNPARPGLASTIFQHLPVDEKLADQLTDLAIGIDPETSGRILRKKLENGDWAALKKLGQLGDGKAILEHIKRRSRKPQDFLKARDYELVLAAVDNLPRDAARSVVVELIKLMPQIPDALLKTVLEKNIVLPEIRMWADRVINLTSNKLHQSYAIRYLSKVAPESLHVVLENDKTVENLSIWLSSVEVFDWVGFSQDIMAADIPNLSDKFAKLASRRRIVLTLTTGAHRANNFKAGWFALSSNRQATSHLLAVLAKRGPPRVALDLLAAMMQEQRNVESLGEVRNPLASFQVVVTWLASGVARTMDLRCIPTGLFGVERLNDKNHLVVRAASHLVLANTKAAANGNCIAS
ncbi:MAG: hypothetical protein AAGD43_03075 [Pseudomonadota bacterium]